MNSTIHLRELPGGDWEILSVLSEGSRVQKTVVTTGITMTVLDRAPQEVYDYLDGRFALINVPKAWLKRFLTKQGFTIKLEELQGYLKGAA
jgi:hypothetical protein